MKKYKFEVVVTEQNDEFWEDLEDKNKSGCDEMLLAVSKGLDDINFAYILKLVEYTND